MPDKITPGPGKYIDPLVDFAFKKIFGSEPNKDLLIAFLNEVFHGRKHIIDLVYDKNEHHGDIKGRGCSNFRLTLYRRRRRKVFDRSAAWQAGLF